MPPSNRQPPLLEWKVDKVWFGFSRKWSASIWNQWFSTYVYSDGKLLRPGVINLVNKFTSLVLPQIVTCLEYKKVPGTSRRDFSATGNLVTFEHLVWKSLWSMELCVLQFARANLNWLWILKIRNAMQWIQQRYWLFWTNFTRHPKEISFFLHGNGLLEYTLTETERHLEHPKEVFFVVNW